MEIERDVKIEKGGNLEVGFLTGPRTAEALPDFSDDELRQELGNTLTARIQKLFGGAPKTVQPARAIAPAKRSAPKRRRRQRP